MSYIPPHKRHSKDPNRASPTPERLSSHFEKNLYLRSSGSNVERRKDKRSLQGGKIIYAKNAVSRWFAVGLDDDEQLPTSAHLEPISLKSFEQKSGEPPLTLVLDNQQIKEGNEAKGDNRKSPWGYIATRIEQDLISSFQNVRMLMEGPEPREVKPTLVVRFGRILFHGITSVLETSSSVTQAGLKQSKRTFYTNLPPSYMKYVKEEAVPKIGLDLEVEKELYHVKLLDSLEPESTISCKCRIMKNSNKLELYKIELNQVRHFVVDISCLDRKPDMRLMLYTKRIVTTLTVDDKHSIESLISSAVLDPDVKGGLRWPLGKESSGDRYTVVGVWHTNTGAFRNSLVRLKVRQADRFDFRTSAGEVTGEVILKMTGLASQYLQEQKFGDNLVIEMLKDYLKMICDLFLSSSFNLS